MRFLIVLLLALAAAAGLWVLYSQPVEARRVDDGLATPDRAPRVRDHTPAELEQPAPVEATGADAASADARGSADEHREHREHREAIEPPPEPEAPTREEELAAKYADHSVQDLNRASRTLYAAHRDAIHTLMQERYANAFYDAYPYEYGPDGERLAASDVIPGPPAGEHRIRQIFEDPEVDEWRLVELPPAEHPELYEQYAEYRWVSDEAKRRAREE